MFIARYDLKRPSYITIRQKDGGKTYLYSSGIGDRVPVCRVHMWSESRNRQKARNHIGRLTIAAKKARADITHFIHWEDRYGT